VGLVGEVGAELLGQEVGEWHGAALARLGRPQEDQEPGGSPLDLILDLGQLHLSVPPGPPLDRRIL
jgi:hypothetical protein